MEIKFTKYDKYGAYHWKQYLKGGKYARHVNRIKDWVAESVILDIGCGDGCITDKLGAFGIDNEETAIKLAQSKMVPCELGNAYDLSKWGLIEAVTMFDVLEHFEFPEKVLEQVALHTKTVYISTPPKRDNGKLTDPKFHVQEWSPEGLERFMNENGWDLVEGIVVYPSEKLMYGKFTYNPVSDSKQAL